MTQPAAHRDARRALTVIEVLVILSIIALVLAIAVPPHFGRSKGGARRIACNANLRGISQAALVYAEGDSAEVPIPVSAAEVQFGIQSHLPAYAYGGKSGRGSGGADSPWGLRAGLGSAHRPLNAILYPKGIAAPSAAPTDTEYQADAALALDVYRCPTDTAFAGTHHRAWRRDGLSAYDHYGTSYAANILYALTDESPDRLVSISPYRQPVSLIPAPDRTVLFMENAGRFAFMHCTAACPATCPLSGALPPTSGTSVGGHNGGYNIAFTDGHSEWMKIDGHAPSNAVPDAPWDVHAALRVRGLDWRLDVLPAQPAVTRHTPLNNRRVQVGDPADPDFELVVQSSP